LVVKNISAQRLALPASAGFGGKNHQTPNPPLGLNPQKCGQSPHLSACTLCWARNEDTLIFKDLTKFYNQLAFLFQPKFKLSQPGFGPRFTRRQVTIPGLPANADAKPKPANFGG